MMQAESETIKVWKIRYPKSWKIKSSAHRRKIVYSQIHWVMNIENLIKNCRLYCPNTRNDATGQSSSSGRTYADFQ